ncbi:MAG: squalene synthase HpnC [Dehalococcoidia bacterium]|nr:squalene synthase HpnC [Dehalococcoidia bacterium]
MSVTTATSTAGSPTLQQAYAECRRLATRHYENFPIASLLLPRSVRPQVFAVYAFCRHTDDIGDEAPGDRLKQLDEWEDDLRRCYGGAPCHHYLAALQDTIEKHSLPIDPFLKLIEANRMDQGSVRFHTRADLLYYCDHSANPVGRIVLRLFGLTDEERDRLSDAVCTGLQLANFCQDVGVDLASDRIYIPTEEMHRFGYDEVQLRARAVNGAFLELMNHQVGRARQHLAAGWQLGDQVSGRLKYELRAITLGGFAILDAIEGQGFDVFSRRPRLSTARRASLIASALLPRSRPPG